jgi:hypothetical protein
MIALPLKMADHFLITQILTALVDSRQSFVIPVSLLSGDIGPITDLLNCKTNDNQI